MVGPKDESEFTRQVKRLFESNGWFFYHTHRSDRSEAGFPDCVMVHLATGRTVYVELKMPDNLKPSKAQVNWLNTLSIRNEVYLWTPMDWDYIAEIASGQAPLPGHQWQLK